MGDCAGKRCGIGGAALGPPPAFGGRGGAFLSSLREAVEETGDIFLPSSLTTCWTDGWMANVFGRVCAEVWVPAGTKVWGSLCTGEALMSRLSSLGEPSVRAGGEGLKAEVKGCGGQLGVLRGGTGGKEGSEGGETWGAGGQSTGVVERNFVLSLGTGLSLSSSTPPSACSSFLCLGAACLLSGTGFFSLPSSSFILDTCLSLGTGFSLSLGAGLGASPSLVSRCIRTGFSCTGTGTGLSLSSAWACPVSCAWWACASDSVSRLPWLLLRLAKMRLWWPGRVMPMASSWSGVRLRHCLNVVRPALWNTSEYCSRRSTHNHSKTFGQGSHWDMIDVWECSKHPRPLGQFMVHTTCGITKGKTWIHRSSCYIMEFQWWKKIQIFHFWTELNFSFHPEMDHNLISAINNTSTQHWTVGVGQLTDAMFGF